MLRRVGYLHRILIHQTIKVGTHERKKRGRNPLDAMLPRKVVRHKLPESERACAHDGHALVEIGRMAYGEPHTSRSNPSRKLVPRSCRNAIGGKALAAMSSTAFALASIAAWLAGSSSS